MQRLSGIRLREKSRRCIFESMPYVQIITKVSAPVEQNAFHADIAEAMALLPDVEKDWTMTSLAVDSNLRYEGSNAPAATINKP